MISISTAIELAVAPVFLLAGIGAILNVLAGRMARIIDRNRVLHARLLRQSDKAIDKGIEAEISLLEKRGRIVHISIAFATTSALFVSCLVVLIFIGSLMQLRTDEIVAAMFILAMLSVISALLGFLREVQLATSMMMRGP